MTTKLLAVAMLKGVVALQFAKAPHWVEHTYKDQDGNTVNINSGIQPAISAVSGKSEGKKTTTVSLTVPTNGGLNDVFQLTASDDAEALRITELTLAAVEASNKAASEDAGPTVISG